jgi:phage tail-like protein
MSTSPVRIDPYGAFNFLISFAGAGTLGGFSECAGLEMTLDIEEYREGGNNSTTLRFPSRIKWTNLRLKHGLTSRNDLWLWHYSFVQGSVQRRDGLITLQDEQKNAVRSWSFTRGIPVKWSGPTMNASQSQIAIEELEIAHEGLSLL